MKPQLSTVRSDKAITCGYKDAFVGPKRWRKLQAVRVMASLKAITVDWLSCSKFGSARLTSQTRADHNGK
jgi:hypothetical protein